MKKEKVKSKDSLFLHRLFFSVFFLFTFSFLVFPFGASAGVIRKPPNNLGIMLYYPMDEGNGTVVADHSGNRRNGTFMGTTLPTWANGKRGKAVAFDGLIADIQNRIELQSTLTLSNTHTVSMWLYLNGNCNGPYGIGVNVLFSSGSLGDVGLYCNGTAGNKISYFDGNNYNDGTTALALNRWYHVVVVNSGGSATFYLNGAPDGTASAMPGYGANAIGSDTISINATLHGKIDELRVYNRALSASEILTIYQAGSARLGISSSPANLLNGLTGWWTFDGKDMVSNVADVSGNGRHGYLVGFTSTTTAPGKLGQALNFNNTNKYMSTAGTSLGSFISASNGTISAWVRPTETVPSCTTSAMYSCDYAVSTNSALAGFGIAVGNNTTLGQNKIWAVNATAAMTHQIVGADYTLGEWAHITWVHTGGTLSIYKNGVFVDSVASGDTANMTNSLFVGRGWIGVSNYWNGDVDDVRTWNRGLSASEIKQVYDSTAGAKANKTNIGALTSGLVGYYTFDGPDVDWTANTVTDKSGSGNTGTIVDIATSTGAVAGKLGQALTFNGSSSYIDLGDKTAFKPSSSQSFSVSFWYKGLSGSNEMFLGHSPNIGNYWYIGKNQAYFCGGTACAVSRSNSYTLPNNNDWHHLVAVLDRSTSPDSLNVYLDGASTGTQSGALDGNSTTWGTNTLIGMGSWAATQYRQGPMDEVRIYNRALSQSEVTQLYKMGK